MSMCPNGHDSKDPDWCDTCGSPMNLSTSSTMGDPSPDASQSSPASAGAAGSAGATSSGATTACPNCNDMNPASNLFCESCGTDFVTGQKPAPAPTPTPTAATAAPVIAAAAPPPDPGVDLGWTATLTVDNEWFAAKGEGIGTPPTRAPIVVELRHNTVVIGRSRSSGANPGVVIDDDHGISRKHAELSYDADVNMWSVTDLGSTNGTFVLADGVVPTPDVAALVPSTPQVLGATDRVHVGAWTRIELTPTTSAPTTSAPTTPAPTTPAPTTPAPTTSAPTDPASVTPDTVAPDT